MRYSKGSATVIGIIIVALVIVAGGGGYYYYTQNIVPKKVLASTIANFTDKDSLKSFAYEGSVDGTYDVQFPGDQQNSKQKQTFSASFNGIIDRTNTDSVKITSDVQINSDGQQPMTVKARIMGSMIYLTLSGDSPAVSSLPIQDGQWLKINTQKDSSAQGQAAPLAELSQIQNPNQWVQTDFSEKEKDQLKDALRKNQFIVVTDLYGTERIKGVSSHHYGYTFRKKEYVNFLKEAQGILGTDTISEEQVSSAEESIQSLDSLNGEIWIGTQNKYLRKLTMNVASNSENSNTTLEEMSFNITMSEYNTDFTVDEPESAKSLSEMFNSFFPEASQSSTTQSSRETSPEEPNVPAEFDIPESSNNSASELTEEQKQQLFKEYQGNSSSQ